MSKEQLKWDMLLMRAWQNERKFGWVLLSFFDSRDDIDLSQMIELLLEMKIKRCFVQHRGKNDKGFIPTKMPVREFVNKYCRVLSDKLWDGELAAQYAMTLDDYEWTNTKFIKEANANSVRKYRRKLKGGSSRYIPLAGGDLSNHQWKKVK